MLKTLTKIALLLCLPFAGFSQKTLVKDSVFDKHLEILVPKDVKAMTQEMWSIKYPGVKLPPVAFSDDNLEVNLIGRNTGQPLTEDQLGEYANIQLGFIKKKYPGAEVIFNGTKMVNGKKIALLKLISPAIDQKVFNCFIFVVLKGQVLLFNFNCPERMRADWETTADSIAASIKIL